MTEQKSLERKEILNDDSLRLEINFFHTALFKNSAPIALIEQYVLAEMRARKLALSDKIVKVEKIVSLELDFEAIEIALRLRHRRNDLTRKVHTFFYLSEVKSQYLDKFVSMRPAHNMISILNMTSAVFRTAYKTIKGFFLIWRYQLA